MRNQNKLITVLCLAATSVIGQQQSNLVEHSGSEPIHRLVHLDTGFILETNVLEMEGSNDFGDYRNQLLVKNIRNKLRELVVTRPEVGDSVQHGSRGALMLELGGKAYIYHLEYDFWLIPQKMNKNNHIELVLGGGFAWNPTLIFEASIPLTCYVSYGGNFKGELGLGTTVMFTTNPSSHSREEHFAYASPYGGPFLKNPGFNYNIQLGARWDNDIWIVRIFALIINEFPSETHERKNDWLPWFGTSIGLKI